MNIPLILPSYTIKILCKSVKGFMSYDRTYKQTKRDSTLSTKIFHTNISYPFIKLKNNNKSSSSFYKNPANSIYTVFFKDSVRGWKIKSMLNMIPIFTLDH